MKKQIKSIRDKEFVPVVLLGLLMISITWGTRIIGDGAGGVSRQDAAAATPAQAAIQTKTPNLDIMIVAHRGVKLYAPENTLPAFQKAIDLGYSYVELDVQYSRDGVPVVMHDAAMSRTTDRDDIVSFIPLSRIKKADAGSWFGKEFTGTRVPALEEALQLMKGHIKLYLDQKADPRPVLIELLKKYDFYPDNLVVVGGDDLARKFLKLAPDAPAMPGLSSADEIDAVMKDFPHPRAFNTNCETLTPEMVAAAHARGVMIFSNVLEVAPEKEIECMKRVINLGADAIQIDRPDLLLPLLDEMRKAAGDKK